MQELEPIPEAVENDDEESRTTALIACKAEELSTACSTTSFPSPSKLLEFPHACVAFSDVATWGSPSSVDTETDVPSTSDELSLCDEFAETEVEFDDDFAWWSRGCS